MGDRPDAVQQCIDACVKHGMKLQFAVSKYELKFDGAHDPEYRKLYREMAKLKREKHLRASKKW